MSNPGALSSTAIASNATGLILFCTSICGGILLSRKQGVHSESFPSASRSKPSIQGEKDDTEKGDTAVVTSEASHDKNLARQAPNDSSDAKPALDTTMNSSHRRVLKPNTITIAYASTTGTCESYAKILHSKLKQYSAQNCTVQLVKISNVDWWDELLNEDEDDDDDDDDENDDLDSKCSTPSKPAMIFFLVPTWSGGTFTPDAMNLCDSLNEISTDWRIAPKPLASASDETKKSKKRTSKLSIGIFGMGSSAYDRETFCKPAKTIRNIMGKLGADFIGRAKVSMGMGDDAAGDSGATFETWSDSVVKELYGVKPKQKKSKKGKKSNDVSVGCCQEEKDADTPHEGGCACKEGEEEKIPYDDALEDEDLLSYYSSDEEDDDDWDGENKEPDVIDLEDLGNAMNADAKAARSNEPKEMVTPKQAIALKKEGYKLIGTHSAVKLCRWTKHQLRGRGGCYKHTFYGITSYQCMEATPSLACANKCVFCWRHHKNPVGKEWRWKTDDPHFIVDEAIKTHISMIREARGIPGIIPERYEEALNPRHCALSLVGEPIMYPRIDEFLYDLHERKVSTFLVTNGQHPQAIADLRPVTQLYVSVDAPTPKALIEIDRPLFNDAWERLQTSLKCLKDRGQRTVARLTVVKGWNMNEVEGYAKLIALGHCSLVEVKGVTFCGKSDASNLNMSNSPWHHEVVNLVRNLRDELSKMRLNGVDVPEYDLACEHKHSVSVLLARVDQFSVTDDVTGKRIWKTWIDYEKFHELTAKHAEDPTFKFGVKDYVAETPEWAVFGAQEEGFDPTDKRHRRKSKHPMYTQFDDTGVPTHDSDGLALATDEKKRLTTLMEEKRKEIGDVELVEDKKGGEKKVTDASLMFRGLTVIKK